MNAPVFSILPCAGWPHNELAADFKGNAPIWREVSADFYREMLNVLPPVSWKGWTFAVGEPYTHLPERGRIRVVYCVLTRTGGRCFARYLPEDVMHQEAAVLAAFVAGANRQGEGTGA